MALSQKKIPETALNRLREFVISVDSSDKDKQVRKAIEDQDKDFKTPKDYAEYVNGSIAISQNNLDLVLKRENADRAFKLAVGWSIFIAAVILFKMIATLLGYPTLDNYEFNITIGTLSGTVLVFYTMVIRHLFPRGNK